MRLVRLVANIQSILVLSLTMAIAAPAQTFTTLAVFDPNTGSTPLAPLIQGLDGNLYGTARDGGNTCATPGCGTIYKLILAGALTPFYNFCSQANCTDGEQPIAPLLLATDGNYYGIASAGGQFFNGMNYGGTVFKITPGGSLTNRYNFCSQTNCADGADPNALIQAADGNYYGTTAIGGRFTSKFCGSGCGTIFKLTPGGKFTSLYSFCSQPNCSDGITPTGLVQGKDGSLYGTTNQGGVVTANCNGGCGTSFKITLGGQFTTIHSFSTGPHMPIGTLIQATDGNFYGVTIGGYGAVFRMTPTGTVKLMHLFCAKGTPCTDGDRPRAGVIQATDGNIYGTAGDGGAHGVGTIFKLTLSGAFTTLYNFCSQSNCSDGVRPNGLFEATNGILYGTTAGGPNETAFSLSLGMNPCVQTVPTSGSAGKKVIILGTDLSGTTDVRFNGIAATFAVVSAHEIKTFVPTGATSGTVQVATPRGTLNSGVEFWVP